MQRHGRITIAIAIAMVASTCTDEGDRTDDGAGTVGPQTTTTTITTTDTTTPTTTITTAVDTTENPTTEGPVTTLGTTAGTGTAETTATSEATIASTDGTTTGDPSSGMLPHEESFDGPDGAPWPEPWIAAGTAVISTELQGDRGHLVGQTGRVARMVLPGFAETDVDAVITIQFDDWTQQGFGLYVRQNGGALQETDPPGQGYAAYVEGGYMQMLGIWRETNGVEELLQGVQVPGGLLEAGVPYRMRLQVRQEGPHTRLRTRLWPAGADEPSNWQVDMIDDTPVLQDTAGSFALDLYNYAGTGGVLVDDLRIEPL